MAYQTGVTTTLSDLIATVVAFGKQNGFTEGPKGTYTGTAVTGSSRTFNYSSLQKNGVFNIFFIPTTGTMDLFIHTATSLSGNVWAGASAYPQKVSGLVGPHVGYHLFCDGLCLNVAVEIVTGVFVHFNFGEIVKNGDWVGGQFVTGLARTSDTSTDFVITASTISLPFEFGAIGSNKQQYSICGHIRTPLNGGGTANLNAATSGGSSAWFTGLASNCGRILVDRSPNQANGRAVLVPFNLVQASSGNQGPYYQLGYVSNACAVNIANLNPKETVNSDWMVFPICQKNGPATNYINSQNYGLAYKK